MTDITKKTENSDPLEIDSIAYICDRSACSKDCPSKFKTKADCHHTTNIRHAKNFIQMAEHKFFEEPQIANIVERKHYQAGFCEYFLDCGHSVYVFIEDAEPCYCSVCGKLIEEAEEYVE
jgi:hypothetical protein